MELFQKSSQRARSRHIVSAIQKESSDVFQTAGPGCRIHAFDDGRRGKAEALGCQDSNSNIVDLMAARQTRPQIPIWPGVEFEIAVAQRADIFFKISGADQ